MAYNYSALQALKKTGSGKAIKPLDIAGKLRIIKPWYRRRDLQKPSLKRV